MAYIGKQPVVGNFVKLDAIVTSATATYNLLNGGVAYFPQTANNCIVSLNGVIQSPTSAYTISGSTIVFDSALTSADSIDFILVLGDVLNIGTPSDATVGFAKVTSNLITGATAETSIDGADSVLIYDDSASALRKMTRTNFVSGIGGTNTPAFAVSNSGDQTITTGTDTKLTLGSEIYDTNSAFDSTTNYRFTVPTAKNGRYLFYVNTNAFCTSANATSIIVQLYKNGSAVGIAISEIYTSSTSIFRNMQMPTLISTLDLVATDYVEVYGKVSGGGSVGFSKTQFGGFKIIE